MRESNTAVRFLPVWRRNMDFSSILDWLLSLAGLLLTFVVTYRFSKIGEQKTSKVALLTWGGSVVFIGAFLQFRGIMGDTAAAAVMIPLYLFWLYLLRRVKRAK